MSPISFFDIWENTTADEWTIKTAGVLFALAGIWNYGVRPLLRFRRLAREGWHRVMQAIDLVEHELKPNGGKTLRDAVNRVEATTNATAEQVAALTKRVDLVEDRSPESRTRQNDLEVTS